MLAAATLAYCLFVRGGSELFRDSDSGWHIRNGESILASHSLPRTDPYSFSKPGKPWIAWEWLSDVIMGWTHREAGLRGVAALFSLAIAVCTWIWTRLCFAMGSDFFLTALMAPVMVTTASLHWLARPHVLAWILLLATLWMLERVAIARRSVVSRERQRPALLLLAVLFGSALWANLHASFFLAPALAIAYAIGERSLKFVWIALAALGGSFLNPYGWHLHAHILSYLTNEELTSRVAEFQSFNFHDKNATQIAIAMALGAAGAVLALTQRKYSHFFVAGALWFAALRSARVIPLVALAALPIAGAAITQSFGGWKYARNLRAIDAQINGAVFALVLGGLMLIALRALPVGFSPKQYPVHAADAIVTLPATARIMSSDHFGGYLIYRFAGARKVFFDGRSDFYGADFMKRYFTLSTARPGWREMIKEFAFTHALLPNDSALGDALSHEGWRKISQDDVAMLLEAPQ